ncbi:dsDNA nuclease domain-containing protein [Nonomuraea sp. N2-4H]|uniref:dsDNA nuclease domain-containing protein n=1 Tax=Nonomuraea sp. N2-4H TaxID=3128898 RepID=UPI00324505F3
MVESPQPDLLSMLAQMESEKAGLDTFKRYVWQAKQALRQWLTCLSDANGLKYLICEHIEDITMVYSSHVRYLQLKTRDRGSWSASSMCDKGIDALIRSYKEARSAGLHESATFELWMEGPISDASETVAFVADPSSATRSIRGKIVSLGLDRYCVDDFLSRLLIYPDQPTRAHIDAKVLWELGALWPAMSQQELRHLYQQLLDTVSAAQEGAEAPASAQANLAIAAFFASSGGATTDSLDGDEFEPIRDQILSHSKLIALTPPMPGESAEQLLNRIANGSSATLLELKMTAAGAREKTILNAKEMRADMELERQLLLASRDNAEADLTDLGRRVLTLAEATALRLSLLSATNPGAAAHPAEAIAADLLSRPTDLGQCDRKQVFGGDPYLIYGYLGHLSDLCKFPWRAA